MKKNSVLKLAFVFAVVCAALCFSSCAKKSAATEKVTLVLDWTPNTNHTGLYVAEEKGYFTEEGLEVEIIQPSEDGAPMMVASGKAQVGIDCQDTLAPAWDKDDALPVTAVAALLQHNTSGIISLKEKGIEKPADLCGKIYSTWNNPVELAIIKNIVEQDGGDYSKVNLIPSTVYDVITALQSGDTDSVWIFYAWDGIATEKNNIATNFLDFAKINPVFDYYTPIFIANNDFIKNKPETLKKLLKAIKKGYEYSIANTDEAADILCKAAPELDSEMVHKSQAWINEQYKSEVDQWGYIDAERWNAFYKWLYKNKLCSTPLADKNLFTNDFLSK